MYVTAFKLIINVIPFSEQFLFIIIPALLFYVDDGDSTFVQNWYIFMKHTVLFHVRTCLNFLFSYQVTRCEVFFLTKWYDFRAHQEGALGWREQVMMFLNPILWDKFDIQKKFLHRPLELGSEFTYLWMRSTLVT